MTLRRQFFIALTIAALAGALLAGVWFKYQRDFERHLARAFSAGIAAYSLAQGQPASSDFSARAVTPETITSANNSTRLRFPDTEMLNYETSLTIANIPVRILSPDHQYSLAEVKGPPAAQFGQLFRSLATWCGTPAVFLKSPNGWHRIEAPALFSCAAAPADWRTPTLILALIILAGLLTAGLGLSDRLNTLARQITSRAQDGRTTPLPINGPPELRTISRAINRFFDREKQRHSRRAALLSGISHDLGTPTQRLKLRTALIRNQDLRIKLDRDIDQMTSMIDSVLAYTRNEMDVEEMRKIPIYSLLTAITDDYTDLGHSVRLMPYLPPSMPSSKTVFTAQSPTARLTHTPESLLCRCRPNAIRRAINNLIDNALKYGKSATLSVQASAEFISISVQDEGRAEVDFSKLVEPFARGQNAAHHRGTGLGLTIVDSIATNHGGALSFAQAPNGTIVEFRIHR